MRVADRSKPNGATSSTSYEPRAIVAGIERLTAGETVAGVRMAHQHPRA